MSFKPETVLIKSADAEVTRLAEVEPPRLVREARKLKVLPSRVKGFFELDPSMIRCINCGRLLAKVIKKGNTILEIRCERCQALNTVGHRSLEKRGKV